MSDKIYNRDEANPEAWRAEAEKSLRGKGLDTLTWQTPEDIAVKPLYTAEDIEALEYTNTMQAGRASPLPSTWPLTAATIPITRV